MNRTTPLMILATMAVTAAVTYQVATSGRGLPKAGASEGGEPKPAAAAPAKIAGLVLEPAQAGPGWETLALTGRVALPPERMVKVGPRIAGTVLAAYGTLGSPVRRGQLVATLSCVELAEARAQYRQARGRLAAALRVHREEERLVGLGGVADRQLEEARTAALAAQGALAEARGAVAQARSEVARDESELTQCRSRLERARGLFADTILSRQDMEAAEAEFRRDSATLEGARARLAGAEAAVERARSQADIAAAYQAREEKLHAGKLMDTRAMVAARATLDAARLDAAAAEERLRALGADPAGSGDTLPVLAPISGRIVARQVNVGQVVQPSDELFTIADTGAVWVEADLFERDLGRVRTGGRAEVRFAADPERPRTAIVQSVGDLLNPETRTVRVRLALANPGGALRPGMFADVTLLTAQRGRAVLVPRKAVLDDAGKRVVYTPCMECPEDAKAGTNACGAYDRVEVTTGARRDSRIEVLTGLDPGTPVVVEGQFQILSAMGSGQLKAGCADH